MKTLPALILMSISIGTALADTVTFDDLKTGAPPPGWTATKTGKGDPKWEVVADDSADMHCRLRKKRPSPKSEKWRILAFCSSVIPFNASRLSRIMNLSSLREDGSPSQRRLSVPL